MSGIDFQSTTWAALKEWAEARIEASRDQLEQGSSPGGWDDRARGSIAALRALLALEHPPAPVLTSPDYIAPRAERQEVKRA